MGYYSYLPATFIEHDLKLSFINSENELSYSGVKYAYINDSDGHHILKYPMGTAILYTPFFLMAHYLADVLGQPHDGFSPVYQCFIEFSGLFYLIIGLYYLRKLLLQFYAEKVVALSLFFVFFGTNLLCYSTMDSPMSHDYTFSFVSIFLYIINEFYKKISLKNVVILGIVFGIIFLIRPLNVLLITPFLFFNIFSFKDFLARIRFFISNYKWMLVFMGVFLIIISPQFIYYRYVSGHFFVFSYGKEQFYFNQFHWFDFLFGFRKGWFIYTPLMLFVIAGIVLLKNSLSNKFSLSIIILLPVYTYILSSWWCWWYGGSFGQRAMVDVYPLLILPLAALIQYFVQLVNILKNIAFAILVCLVALNIIQTIQYKYNIIDYDGMTYNSYVHVFGTLDAKNIDESLLKKPDYEKCVIGIDE